MIKRIIRDINIEVVSSVKANWIFASKSSNLCLVKAHTHYGSTQTNISYPIPTHELVGVDGRSSLSQKLAKRVIFIGIRHNPGSVGKRHNTSQSISVEEQNRRTGHLFVIFATDLKVIRVKTCRFVFLRKRSHTHAIN